MNAAINRATEFRVHVNGAINNGCTPEEIREVLSARRAVAGIPAANDAHRIALETFREKKNRCLTAWSSVAPGRHSARRARDLHTLPTSWSTTWTPAISAWCVRRAEII